MKLAACALIASLASAACAMGPDAATSQGGVVPAKTSGAAGTFACDDSLQRVDGTQRTGASCDIAREYCYEASGGAAYSHGAHCRSLPKPGTDCAGLVASIGAGASCSGTKTAGLRVQFAFP